MDDAHARVFQALMHFRTLRSDQERDAAGGFEGLGRLADQCDSLGLSQIELAGVLADIALQSRIDRLDWKHAVENRADLALSRGDAGIRELASEAQGSIPAPDSALAWDACALIAERESIVPDPIKQLMSMAMRGAAKRPSVKSGERTERVRKHDAIMAAMRLALESGLAATQNHATSGAVSCSAIVAERAKPFGIVMDAASVADLWQRRKREHNPV
jgi:hypothetical protein